MKYKLLSILFTLCNLLFLTVQAKFSQPKELDTPLEFGGIMYSYFENAASETSLGTGVDRTIYSLALQPDGKVLIGGEFTSYNGTPCNRVARLNADGSLDATFNPGTGANSDVLSLALQPDGKVLIVGVFTSYNGTSRNRIARLNADGSLDATFNPGTGADTWVWSLALQSDGKVLIGGSFSSYNGTPCNRVARLNPDGSIDATFNSGTGANNDVYSFALQPDGKVLIGGNFTSYNGTSCNRIARLNADGSLDATFNPGTGASETVFSLALQPDGKALIGGGFNFYNGIPRSRIARLNTDGTVDNTFNPGTGADGTVRSFALQPDGKVLIGGDFTSYNGTSRNRIARLNADGTLDNTSNPRTGADATVRSLALQPDGMVLIGGDFTSYNITPCNRIARLFANGSLDASFNPLGIGANNRITSLALQPDGKVLIGGNFTIYNGTPRNRIARLNADGSLDASFNPGTGADSNVLSLALQPDGKVLIGGVFTNYNGTPRNHIARLNADGSLDATFNPGSGADNWVRSLALQPDGKVLIVGNFTTYNGTPINRIARLNANGSLDATFNPGTGPNGDVLSLNLQPDGKVLIGGVFTSYNGLPLNRNRIARLNADGSLDDTFNPGTGANSNVLSFGLQPDGKVLIGGSFSSYNSTLRRGIARLNTNGSLDAAFNPGTGLNNIVSSFAPQPNGKVLIGGFFTLYNGTPCNRIARLNADGSLDATFNPGTGADGNVWSLVQQPDGKLLIGGDFTSFNGSFRKGIARLNANGSLDANFNLGNGAFDAQAPGDLDTTFNFGGIPHSYFVNAAKETSPGLGANEKVSAISLQPDGKVLIGGRFTSYNGTSRNGITRLNSDGTLDASFNPGTGLGGGGALSAEVNSLAIQPDGKVFIGGNFTSYNGTLRNRIARLNSDGTLDNTFNPGTGADGWVYSLALQSDGKVLIAGSFFGYNGTPRNRIARLNADGSLDASFNPGIGANATVFSLAPQPDGKVLIVGTFTSYNGTSQNRIARLNADGSLDASFNPGTGPLGWVYSLALQSDGKVLIGGDFNSYNGTPRNYIARLNADGTLDNTFDPGAGANGRISSLYLQPNGKVLIGGDFISYDDFPRIYIARLFSDGSLDGSFFPGSGASAEVSSFAFLPGGKVLIGGEFTSYNETSCNRLARLNTNGSLDATFNPVTGTDNFVRCLAPQPDGKVLIGGQFNNYNGTPRNRIARLNADGSLDNSFNPATGANNFVRCLARQPDGKVLIGGAFTSYNGTSRNYIARLNADGNLDGTFDPGSGPNGFVQSITLQPDGKVLISGFFTSYNGTPRNLIARLNANGSLDASFNPGSGVDNEVEAIVLQPDGKVLIGGGFTSYNGIPCSRIARLNADGSLDVSLNPGTGVDGSIRSLALQSDGKVLIAGFFTAYNGTFRNHIARLNSNGSLDASFNPGTGANESIFSLALQPDGKVLIGGEFTSYNGTSRNRIARLNANGSLDATFNPGAGVNEVVYCSALQPDGKVMIGGFFTSYNGVYRSRIARVLSLNCVTTPSAPTVQAPAAICAGNTITITPTAGGANYRFYATSTGGSPLAGGNGVASFATPALNSSTTFYVASLSAEGCESSSRTPVSVTVNPTPTTPTATAGGPTTFCSGGSVTLTSSAATGNLWSTGETSQSITVNASGTFTVRQVVAGCTSAVSAQVVTTLTPNPIITTSGNVNVVPGGSATLTASGATVYQWSPLVGLSPANGVGASVVATPAATTLYTVTGTADGCQGQAQVLVTVQVDEPVRLATPIITPGTGSYAGTQSVSISSTDAGVAIYYTTNGSNPRLDVPNSFTRLYTAPFNVLVTTTIRAVAVRAGAVNSPVGVSFITVNNPTVVATPVISPGSGTFSGSVTVTLSTTTADAQLYYTTNGSNPRFDVPNSFTKLYTGPITLYGSATVRAVGTRSGWTNSAISVSNFTVNDPAVVAPVVFSPAPGAYPGPVSLTMSTSTSDATIYYTTNGSAPLLEPFPNSFTRIYDGPVMLNASGTVRARAVRPGFLNSVTSVGIYTLAGSRMAVDGQDEHPYYFEEENVSTVNKAIDVDIYPNPTKGTLILKFSGLSAPITAQLFNYMGQMVHTQPISGPEHAMDIGRFPSGMYMLRVKCGHEMLEKKVIKQ